LNLPLFQKTHASCINYINNVLGTKRAVAIALWPFRFLAASDSLWLFYGQNPKKSIPEVGQACRMVKTKLRAVLIYAAG